MDCTLNLERQECSVKGIFEKAPPPVHSSGIFGWQYKGDKEGSTQAAPSSRPSCVLFVQHDNSDFVGCKGNSYHAPYTSYLEQHPPISPTFTPVSPA